MLYINISTFNFFFVRSKRSKNKIV